MPTLWTPKVIAAITPLSDVASVCVATTSVSCSPTASYLANAIAEEIAFGKEGFIVIVDEYNEIFLHSDITAMETTIDGSFQ